MLMFSGLQSHPYNHDESAYPDRRSDGRFASVAFGTISDSNATTCTLSSKGTLRSLQIGHFRTRISLVRKKSNQALFSHLRVSAHQVGRTTGFDFRFCCTPACHPLFVTKKIVLEMVGQEGHLAIKSTQGFLCRGQDKGVEKKDGKLIV